MKIKAALVKEKGAPYEITELELAEVGSKDVLVKIVASGLCRSDYGERNGNSINFPNVLGHEGAGIVEKVGNAVTSVEPGDHVILSYAYCGECKHCVEGHPSSCEKWFTVNNLGKNPRGEFILHTEDGTEVNNFFNQSSFSTYSLTEESNVVKVDKEVDLRLLGPLGCGLGTGSGAVLSVLQPKVGEGIAVFGTGAVGFSAVMAAKIAGCYPIVAIDINDQRLEKAKELGASHIFNSKEDDPEKFIKVLTDGRGLDYVIDSTGVGPVMTKALHSVSNSGTFVPLAVTQKNFEVNTFFDLVFGNKKVRGVLIGDTIAKYHLPNLIEFYKRGEFPFDQFIKYYDFENINQAEADSISGEVIKAVVVMDKDYQTPK
ncbi:MULTISPECIES: NAD(P)-dependent alcohol dehydrogenase [Enterococcus]|uniref:NAD(P)-dependent alcohol dehydrogenase n=1 Tax=Enterococcus TaxID=1350 RepID=UPI0008A4A4F1|nr:MULTISPECIES: NAD(P)-dependent alcohol dehydrogenase [Enterococcus]OFT75865.1 aryl-alcohol dehydrogenase [Enterococcus sp. HMSC05C03]